jgi:hypothetical protein
VTPANIRKACERRPTAGTHQSVVLGPAFRVTHYSSNAQQTIELWCIKRVFSDKAIRICEDVVFGHYRCDKRISFWYTGNDPRGWDHERIVQSAHGEDVSGCWERTQQAECGHSVSTD